MAKKQFIKQSETVEILRSQINLNPFNPKRHTDKKVAEQKKNLQRVGYLGGITWNRRTGNLIDGHRRIKALDLYYGYDGSRETDYKVKVEAVDFDEKTEKEQMTYMALGNTKADYQLIAEYLPDIDYLSAGIDEYDYEKICSFIPSTTEVEVESYDDLLSDPEDEDAPEEDTESNAIEEDASESTDVASTSEELPEDTESERKAKVKEAKRKQMEAAEKKYEELNAYLTISFENPDEKHYLCEMLGISVNEKYVKSSQILNLIE